MTEKEYMSLHKTHRLNKVQKYLHNPHADGKPPNVIPRIGQHVRSYRLNENTSTCETQQGMIQSYTGDPRTPYRVFSLERLSQGLPLLESVTADAIKDRLVQADGLTTEEMTIKDELVVQTLSTKTTLQQAAKIHALAKQGDIRSAPSRKALKGGVTAVYRENGQTYNEVIYEDMRTEKLTTAQLLAQTAFQEDPRRRQRLEILEEQRMIAAHSLPTRGPVRALAQKRSRRRRRRTQATDTHRSPSNTSTGGRVPVLCRNLSHGGFLSPTKWSWSRPGLFSTGAPHVPAPQGREAGRPAGPGLPNGDATGDGD